MNLHEYQAKELLVKFNLPLLKGKAYSSNLSNLKNDLSYFKGPPWVIKSQIHAGGRGAGYFKNDKSSLGGVRVVNSKEELLSTAKFMIGNTLITKQTGPSGKKVNHIFIEEGCEIHKEFYLSFLIDRKKSLPMMMISSEGGIDIEDVAKNYPNKIFHYHIRDFNNFKIDSNLEENLKISLDQLEELNTIISNILKAFKELDASTIEINPLVLNNDGHFVLLDSKITIDDNALFRHPKILSLKDETEENPLELEASKNNMNYIKLNGSVGCMVNGAGLAMATMDIIKQYGAEPANFLDLGGTANKERAAKGFSIIKSDQNVKSVLINIFGGIIHCDMIASGIVEAIKELNFQLPVVVRFQGTNALEGRNIINQSTLNIISIDELNEATKKVVELSKK